MTAPEQPIDRTETRPTISDAFGAALRECFDAGGVPGVTPQIIERDDGFIESNDMAVYFEQPDQWSELDRWACDAVRGHILDIGAGAGRHALFLQERGHDVTALDTSHGAVTVCEARGVSKVFEGTIEDLVATAPAAFHGFVLLGNNLGLLRDRDYAPRFLEALASIAAPSATLAGTCIDPYTTQHPEHLAYHDANRSKGRMAGQVRIRIRHRGVATPWWEYLFASPAELAEFAAPTPWRIVEQKTNGPLYAMIMRLS
ncbi:MAG TPA: methyltransferase domain-containing protein [Dehalococcoidia bacterium]|jgi:SAM-dependent methyltransferase|nr:methyltransferase domain-containing protein [Dehalococcoidia bacterium]